MFSHNFSFFFVLRKLTSDFGRTSTFYLMNIMVLKTDWTANVEVLFSFRCRFKCELVLPLDKIVLSLAMSLDEENNSAWVYYSI